VLLQPYQGRISGQHYLPSTPETIRWGWLPNREAEPVLTIDDGATLTVDTISHEGILEDQGRDPVAMLARHGVSVQEVLDDARDLAASGVAHHLEIDGPHVITGPVEVRGARPGDLLEVEVLELLERAPYGFISNRHGTGALAGELPETPPPGPDASTARFERYGTVTILAQVEERGGAHVGTLALGGGRLVRFPLAPFLGIMAVAPDTSEPVHSVPPGRFGGNVDLNELVVGSRLYLPVQSPGALFSVGDPHYAQGDGEVCLTALEAPLRATLRLRLRNGEADRRLAASLAAPLAETDTHWIPMGLHEDLNEALRRAVRSALDLLVSRVGTDRAIAYAYLSAAADFEVTQVVDRVKGVHCLVRKADFAEQVSLAWPETGGTGPAGRQ
jgi:acetamidase/formamidase